MTGLLRGHILPPGSWHGLPSPEGGVCVHWPEPFNVFAVRTGLRVALSSRVRRAKVYHVLPHPVEGWKVEHEGARRPSGVLATRAAAIQRAQQLARIAGSDHIVIHDRKGRVSQTVVESVMPRNSVEYEADGSHPRD